jgi:hypothetical protein
MCGPPVWRFDEGLTTPHRKKKHHVTKCYIGPRSGSCQNCNEASGSTNRREFLEQWRDYHLLKESALWNSSCQQNVEKERFSSLPKLYKSQGQRNGENLRRNL